MSESMSQQGGSGRADQSIGVSILSTLIAGLLFYGGLGWVADHFMKTRFIVVIGLVVGLVLSLYMIIKKYGSVE